MSSGLRLHGREGLALCGVLSTMKTYSEAEPLTLMLGPGEHAIDDTWAELDAYGCKSAMRQTTLATILASGEVDEEEFIPPDVLLLQREEEREKWNQAVRSVRRTRNGSEIIEFYDSDAQ